MAINIDIPSLEEKQAKFRQVIEDDLGLRLPARGGVFHDPLRVEEIYQIGGQDDRNDTLTRRMLLLLEGEWLFNRSGFDNVRRELLEHYLYEQPQEDKICLFLLNDVIRYWRTLCTDLEHKIRDQGKPRAIRVIKLRFSRMLLYVSGVLTIGHGHRLCYEDKIQSLSALFGEYPINRILSIAGEEATPVLDLYAEFLKALDTPSTRNALEDKNQNGNVFEEMSNKAGQFRDNLHHLFQTHFADGNPTLRALLL